MNRTAAPTHLWCAMASLALVALTLVVTGCARLPGLSGPGHPPAGQPSPAATPTGLVVQMLSTEQPSVRIVHPPQPRATVIRLGLQSIQNPSGQGLTLAVAIEDTATPARHVDIGYVGLYLSDRPTSFLLALPGPAAALVHEGPTVLTVTLIPVQSGASLRSGIRLRLTAWLAQL